MNILFVCTGNTCRSPMAEGLFNNYFKQSKLNNASSAGISVISGSKVSKNSVETLKAYDIDISCHIPRQLTEDMLKEYDLVITMSRSHKDFIISFWPKYSDKIHSFSEYADSEDIFDPYGCDLDVYKLCASQINNGITNLIESLKLNA